MKQEISKTDLPILAVFQSFADEQILNILIFLNFPASWKSLLDTMGLKAEDGCPNGTEELWVTVQAAKCLCHFEV